MAKGGNIAEIPRLSLKQFTEGSDGDRLDFSAELVRGLKDFGFAVLYDHKISPELLSESYQLSADFFALDLDVKNKYTAKVNGGQRGYTAFGVEHAKDAAAIDLKEFWHVGQELSQDNPLSREYADNLWPSEVARFKEVFLEIYQSLEAVGRSVLHAISSDLGVPRTFFDEMTKDGNSILRLLHYPPIPGDVDPNAIRAAAHEDINLITLLVSASASGLQLLDRQNNWIDVKSKENDIIVDSGDMLARITNLVYPATTHRVINPDDSSTSRYSMPFFMHPHPQAMLSCLKLFENAHADQGEPGAKFPDITAHDFLMQRLREIGLIT